METKTIDYGGRKMVYRCTGSGPLLLLLHGFGEDGAVWRNQFGLFPHHRLVVPDLPGTGASEVLADMSMEGLADAVLAVVRAETEADDSAILIGHSMGGYITLAFAEKYPDRLRAFGLFHSTAFADTEEKKETRRKGITFINEQGADLFLTTTIPNLFAPQTKEKYPALVDEQLAGAHNFSAASLVWYYKAMMARPDRSAVLKQSRVPVLFVMGQYDTAVPLADGLRQCHLPKLSYIHLLQSSGHMGMLEEPEAANNILSQFITLVATVT